MLLLGGTLTFGQSREEPPPPTEEKPALSLPLTFAAGWGSMFADENTTLSKEGMYATVRADLLGVDLFDATSGLGLQVAFGGDYEYQVWSLNRAVLPGMEGAVYAGSDLKLFQSTAFASDQPAAEAGVKGDFDLRLVTGVHLGRLGPGGLSLELYFIEENRPVSFALVYNFN